VTAYNSVYGYWPLGEGTDASLFKEEDRHVRNLLLDWPDHLLFESHGLWKREFREHQTKTVTVHLFQVALEWIRLAQDDVLSDCELGHFINSNANFGFF
jgi:hypothetical protein